MSATFVNLGFSPDSSYFMFAQYGVDQAAGKPYAETYLVDGKRNDFVDKGVQRKVYDAALEPGQDASGALYALIGEEQGLVKKYKIDHLRPGRLLYLLMDGEEPPASLSFRDFKTGASFDVSLNQSSSELKGSAVASFGIAITYSAKDGVAKRVVGGNPDIKRPGREVLRHTPNHRRAGREDPRLHHREADRRQGRPRRPLHGRGDPAALTSFA